MDVFDAVRTVLAVRKYQQDKPVPPEVTRKIVEAARLTASASNKQPWHFIVVEDRGLLNQLAQMARTGPYIAGAPLAVVVATENTPLALSDGSRAIQSMILVAWEYGVGSNWVGFQGRLDDIRPVLGIPNHLTPLAIVPFGYPEQQFTMGKKDRKPLEEVASLNRFGQPYG